MKMNTSTAKSTNMILFWGCFIALVTTAFGFITRVFLIDTWSEAFDLNPAQAGRLTGIGIWPFFVSIVFFSLFIDRIGYKIAMIFAFIGHVSWGMLGYLAYQQLQVGHIDVAYDLLYWGSLIFALFKGSFLPKNSEKIGFVHPAISALKIKGATIKRFFKSLFLMSFFVN